MNNLTNNILNTGITNILAMLSGTLFLENIKMEKQRTNDSYINILNKFKNKGINGYLSGFFMFGAVSGFLRGCSIGLSTTIINNNIQLNNIYKQKILLGIGTGIAESIIMNPLMIMRNLSNKLIYEDKNVTILNQQKLVIKEIKESIKKSGFFYFYKGVNILTLKRSIDWSTRFYLVEKTQFNYSKYINKNMDKKDKVICTFIGAMFSSPLTTPFDRFIPVIYEYGYKKAYNIIKKEGILTLYTGGIVRLINIGYYTTFIMCFPQILKI